MSCYHPIYAVKIGVKENGKADLKMLGYRPDDRETYIEWHNHRYPRDALVPLPCGQCARLRCCRPIRVVRTDIKKPSKMLCFCKKAA